MDWDCTLTEERLSDALAQTLLPEESAALRAHTDGCQPCKQLLARVGGIVLELHQLPFVDEPPFLASRILARTRGMPVGERARKRWFRWSPAIGQTRFVVGFMTVAATVLIVYHAVNAGAPGKLQFSPASLYHGLNRRAHLTYAHGVKFVNDLRVVYEIQSRLSSPPEPVSQPAPRPEERRPDSDAPPQSETAPPTGRRALHRYTVLAVLMFHDGPQNVLCRPSRSLP
jgi:hypothetical protein